MPTRPGTNHPGGSRWLAWLGAGVLLIPAAPGALPAYLTPDDQFVGIEPPGWVLDGVLKAFLPLDQPAGIDEAAALGVTVVHAGGPSLYHPLRRDDPSSGVPAKEKEALTAGIARAKSHGMRVILGVSPYAPVPIVREHPEWMLHATDDPSIREKAKLDLTTPENIALRSLPLHTPYGEYAIECLVEMMRDLGIDGFSFDGCYHAMINFSPFERELYLKETGRPLPAKIDLNDDGYRLYLLWADEKLEGWYRRLGERLRQVNPEAAIYTWTANAGRYGHFLMAPRVMSARMNRLFGSPVQEWWMDEVNLGATVLPYFGAAYVRAVSGGRVGASEPYLMSRGNPYSTDSFPAHELTVRCLGALTNGSFTPLAQMAGKAATHATLREIQRRKPWFIRLEQEPWAAMLVSEQTRQFYAYGQIVERWLSHALGTYRMGIEEHLPLTLITEPDLRPEVLARHRVLILPNVACLSDAQVETIRGHVRAGGGLVATCETSLCDELGHPRGDFALRDLFGTGYGGRQTAPLARPALDANFALVINDSYWAQRGVNGSFRMSDHPESIFSADPKLQALVPNATASYKGPLVRMSPVQPPMNPALMFFPEGSREPFACATYGRPLSAAAPASGRVVYLAAGLDAALYSYAYPYQRLMLAQAVRWAAGEAYPITVTAPMCVQSTFWRQRDAAGSRWIVHLWNGLQTTAGHGQPDVETPLREEAVPVHDISLRLSGPPAQRTIRAHAEPGGLPLELHREGGDTVIRVPPVAVHLAVVLEET